MKISIDKIKLNNENPRTITDSKFKELVRSIKEFPEMAEVREVVVNKDYVILGGNMRFRAMREAGWTKIPARVVDWPLNKQREFIVKDNVAGGDWDWDTLANEWDIEQLDSWGVKVPTIKNTELLSGLEYKSAYYEPKEKPEIKLQDCVNLTKFNEKVKAIKESGVSEEMQETLKNLAYRFIKIDFENVANYYAFNADEKEKKIIERLRLVLIDDGADGFIEDELLKILSITDEEVKW